MKNLLFVGLILSAQLAFAEDPRVKIEDFSFNYSDPKGAGEATLFEQNQKSLEGVRVEVEKIGEAMSFKVSGSENHEFVLEKAPDVVAKARSMVVDDLDLVYEDSLSFSVLEGEFVGEKDELHLKNFSLQCHKDLSHAEAKHQLIFGCLQKMSVKAQSFSQADAEEGLVLALTKAVALASGARGDLAVKNLDFKITNGKYNLGADIKASMSGRAKSNGDLSFDKKTNVLTIKISEVKFGILGVTGMVFDELKKKENETLKVKKPYVYYQIK